MKETVYRTGIWIRAARPRTLVLAVSTVGMGSFLAAFERELNWITLFLTVVTAILLQILSNLANDYGDWEHGADHAGRSGPTRAVQSGQIPANKMRNAIIQLAVGTVVIGIILVWYALGTDRLVGFLLFIAIGSMAVWAAVSYTTAGVAYGYAGLGDIAVFIFFGWVGVLGSIYLQTTTIEPLHLLPATSCGLFAVGVLNVNNIRDAISDKEAGKKTIPVRYGLLRARLYHMAILSIGMLAALIFVFADYRSNWQILFLISLPLYVNNIVAVIKKSPNQLDPYLKQLSLATLLFVVTFGLGNLFS
jgi:1,4-dihydroxy-2-naphthoate octaprenyltransferase